MSNRRRAASYELRVSSFELPVSSFKLPVSSSSQSSNSYSRLWPFPEPEGGVRAFPAGGRPGTIGWPPGGLIRESGYPTTWPFSDQVCRFDGYRKTHRDLSVSDLLRPAQNRCGSARLSPASFYRSRRVFPPEAYDSSAAVLSPLCPGTGATGKAQSDRRFL